MDNEFKIVKPSPFGVVLKILDGHEIYTIWVHGKEYSMGKKKFKWFANQMSILAGIKSK